jgi:hypothetical protein
MANDMAYDSKKALLNKLVQGDGTVTDLNGNPVTTTDPAYDSKPAIPNKFLNPDGTYSTLQDLIGGSVDTDLFIVVEELPDRGERNKIYLVPKEGESGFVEWIFVDGQWDTIGELDVDLSNYPTTEEMQIAISTAVSATKHYSDTNFLKKDNTTVFTPTGDYNPATKKYVDDAIIANITNEL